MGKQRANQNPVLELYTIWEGELVMLGLVRLGDASGHPCLEKKQQHQEREAKLRDAAWENLAYCLSLWTQLCFYFCHRSSWWDQTNFLFPLDESEFSFGPLKTVLSNTKQIPADLFASKLLIYVRESCFLSGTRSPTLCFTHSALHVSYVGNCTLTICHQPLGKEWRPEPGSPSLPIGVSESCHSCMHFPPPSASTEINTICQSHFAGTLLNTSMVGNLSVYLRLPSFRCRQGTIFPWHNTLQLRVLLSPFEICLSLGTQLELVLNLLCLKHQASVRGSLPTAYFPGYLCQLQGPHEAVRCLSVADSLFHIFI